MKKIVIATAMSLCVVSLAAVSSADTLIMRDGTRVQGTVMGIAAGTITFRDSGGVSRRYATTRVQSLEFVAPERSYGRTDGDRSYGRADSDRSYGRADTARRLEAPSGTELVVRTVERIDSRTAGENQTFAALFEQDVTNDQGRVIVPNGSTAQLAVRQMSSGGVTGSPEVVLDIQSITIDGRRYMVSTTDVTRDSGTGIGKNKRTAETVGGGAALGGIIGAIAGGGKGAAIGVLVGAAGGAGAQILMRGHDVQVPPETVLTFRLDQPVTLQADY